MIFITSNKRYDIYSLGSFTTKQFTAVINNCLSEALGVTKFTTIGAMNLVTLCCDLNV
jgi:hypothetical protein